MKADRDSDLAVALGQVALADAEADEWLVLVLGAILPSLTPEIIRVLVATDSARQKIDKIRNLLKQRGYVHSGVGDQHDPIDTIAKKSRELTERRDLALHSFYGPPSGAELKRFRSRRPDTPSTSIEELSQLARDIRATSEHWAAVVRQLEHQATEYQNQMNEAMALMEDSRELLPARRISDERLAALRANPEGEVRLALKGYGRWRPLSDDESLDEDEQLAILGVVGNIRITLNDGRVIEGVDTGWRDVTELAAQNDPDVELSLIRRVHDSVQFTQRGGKSLPVEDSMTPDTLHGRIFREGAMDALEALPDFVRNLDGFRPNESDVG
ncbi:hypothetical protein [Brachybacterium alimentarium]|uniref:hypothetical protein n=1 Tax=Brachybacterium alimentarium TaxID=47845 RepID=UPI003FD1FB4B